MDLKNVNQFKTIKELTRLGKLGASSNFEVQLVRKDGTKVWVVMSSASFYNQQKEKIGSIAVHIDISTRIILQNELKLAKLKAEKSQKAEQHFVSNMSHKIRTPLNVIIGMDNLLRNTNLNEEQQEYLNSLDSSGSILQGLISDVLDIS